LFLVAWCFVSFQFSAVYLVVYIFLEVILSSAATMGYGITALLQCNGF
jgi:hypothetical protein